MQKNIHLFYAHSFLIGLSFFSAIAVIYYVSITHSYALAMSIFSVVMISSAAFEIPTGIYSDLIGRKKTVVLGSVAILIAAILYAVGQTYLFLFLAAIFEGLSRSFFSGNNDAFLHDILDAENKKEDFGKHLGKIGSFEQLALGIGAILGGFMASVSLKLPVIASIVPYIFLVIVSLFMTDVKKKDNESANIFAHLKESLSIFRTNYKLRLLSFSSVISYGIGEASYQFRPAYVATLWPVWAIGIANTLSSFGASVGFYFAGHITKRFKALNILVWHGIVGRASNIMALLMNNIISPALMTIPSFGYGFGNVAKSELFQKEFTDKQRATMGSINSFVGSLFFGIVSILLGFAADILSPSQGLMIANIILFVPLFIYWKIFAHDKKISTKHLR